MKVPLRLSQEIGFLDWRKGSITSVHIYPEVISLMLESEIN